MLNVFKCLILILLTPLAMTGCSGFSAISASGALSSLRSILTANSAVSGIPAFDSSKALWKQGTAFSLNGPAGCNAIASSQIPNHPELFIGRSAVGSDCPNQAFTLFLGQMDWNTKQITMLRTVLDIPTRFNNGTLTIASAYDPTIDIINGEYWVAFECVVTEVQGTVGSCVAPFSIAGGIDASRLSMVIKGVSSNPANDYYPSGSVPKIVQYNGHSYLYWSMMRVPKSGTGYGDVRSRGVEIAIAADGKMHAIGTTAAIPADSPRSVESLSLGNDSYSDTIADLSQVFVLNGTLYGFGNLGGSNGAGCINPLANSRGCYRTYLVKVGDPLGVNAFGTGSRVPSWVFPSDVGQYPRAVRDPNGQLGMTESLLSARFGGQAPNPRSVGDANFYLLPLPEAGYFFNSGGDQVNDFASPVINEAYLTFLGRNPQGQGIQNWLNYVYSGINLIDLLNALYNSAEYQGRVGAVASNTDFVNGLYQTLLGRQADSSGLNNYLSLLSQGVLTRHAVFTQIVYSAEFAGAHPTLAPDTGAPDAASAVAVPVAAAAPAVSAPAAAVSAPAADPVRAPASVSQAASAVVGTSMASLTALNSGCTEATVTGLACRSAVHHFCIAQGFEAGYGPSEMGGGNVSISCLHGVGIIGAGLDQLSSLNQGCLASAPGSTTCASAANKLCQQIGFASGFGPVDMAGNNINIACLNASAPVADTFSALAQTQPGCSAGDPGSLSCRSAVSRSCQSHGFTSGFGPVDYSGDAAVYQCF